MTFYKLIRGDAPVFPQATGTVRDIIFHNLPHREEHSIIAHAYINNNVTGISLQSFRWMVSRLMKIIEKKGFGPADTVMVLSTTATNEFYAALWFAALVSSGVRVILPFFPSASDFDSWAQNHNIRAVFLPLCQIRELKDYDGLKSSCREIEETCKRRQIEIVDHVEDFGVDEIVNQGVALQDQSLFYPEDHPPIDPASEAVVFSTSGTTGAVKLVSYTHEAIYKNCLAWQQAGLFQEHLCGNSCFTPLFTHTIGVRSLFNAIYSGHPFCFITTDWFQKKPELARFLLLKMRPGHIIGGPALFNILLEMYRQFPDMAQEMKRSLKCLISIGAAFDKKTAEHIRTVTGIELYNAYGTTETQLASISLSPGNGTTPIGKPLPGVALALRATDQEDVFELFVNTPFQSRMNGSKNETGFFHTGDLVRYDEATNNAYFVGRMQPDFFKDGFGIKIPFTTLRQYYHQVYQRVKHIEWFPLDNQPGLAALVFVKNNDTTIMPIEMAAQVKNINTQLQSVLEPLEFAHFHLARLSVVVDDVPVSRKGEISRGMMLTRYEQLITDLKNPFVSRKEIHSTESSGENLMEKYSNPYVAQTLSALKMDVVYKKAKGDYLYYNKNGVSTKVLDLVGGFGGNLLGHNHPAIQKSLSSFIRSNQVALNNQGSVYEMPSLLAQKLNRLFSTVTQKFFKVQFANSGAEAVEIALHHAYFEWKHKMGKLRDQQIQLYGAVEEIEAAAIWERNMQLIETSTPQVIVLNNCFHGYTATARSMMNRKDQKTKFSGLLKAIPLFVDPQQEDWQQQIKDILHTATIQIEWITKVNGSYTCKKENVSNIMAAMIEPVAGEGGIRKINTAVADYLSQMDFPLISDEIQCGLGRTGMLPAYKNAHYYLLGKSLGGGYEKIAAVMIADARFRPLFPKYYASTFANGNMAALAAITTVDLIQKKSLPDLATRQGKYLLKKLCAIAAKFPSVIQSVEGEGLMVGIHFSRNIGKDDNILRILYQHELLGYLVSGWMFHHHNIRILPSLSAPNCLRMEPSFFITKTAIDKFCLALEELCCICKDKLIVKLVSYLIDNDPCDDVQQVKWKGSFPQVIEDPAPGAIKVGFISNFTNPSSELKVIHPGFNHSSETALRMLFNKLQVLLDGKPIKILSRNLMGGRIHFTFYILPFDTGFLENVSRWGNRRTYVAKVQDAVNKLADEGVHTVSLGAYASIITNNGLALASRNGVRILTGNTLTISSVLFHLDKYLRDCTKDTTGLNIAVVGASGNIGSGLTSCLVDEKYKNHKLILIGTSRKRMQKVEDSCDASRLRCSSDMFDLKEADVILCCSNTNDPVVSPHHVSADKPVYIIDISVPAAVSEEVHRMENVTACQTASSCSLQDDPEFLVSAHTEKGKIFCCAAEVLLDGLYNPGQSLKGHIDPVAIQELYRLAEKEKFFN